jgi:hypothetical protein
MIIDYCFATKLLQFSDNGKKKHPTPGGTALYTAPTPAVGGILYPCLAPPLVGRVFIVFIPCTAGGCLL